MASIKVVSPLPLAEQARGLKNFLYQKQAVLSDEAEYAVCFSLGLSSPVESKNAAQQLRSELAVHGIKLGQSHAYEALAKLCGFASWMRLLQQRTACEPEQSREGFAMRLSIVGEDEGAFSRYESLPKVCTTIIETALQRLRGEPAAFCSIILGRKGIRVDFEPANQPGFFFETVAFQLIDDDINFVGLESDSVRTFVSRLCRAIEMGCPGAIVSGATLSASHPHWYQPTFVLRSMRNKARNVMAVGEPELFVMLESLGLDSVTHVVPAKAMIYEVSDDVQLEAAWVCQDSGDTVAGFLTPTQFSTLVQRFLRLKHILPHSFAKVLTLISTGTTDPKNYFPISTALLAQTRNAQGLDLKTLATKIGISLQDMARIEKHGYVHESVIPRLAEALGLGNGNELLPKTDDEGLAIRVETAESLMLGLSDTHWWRRIISDHFTGAERDEVEALAESLQEYGDLIQVGEGVFSDVFHSNVDRAALTQGIQELLDELARLGGTVLVSRSLKYMGNIPAAPKLEGLPLHSVTLFFEKVEKLRAPDGIPSASAAAQELHHG